MSESNKCIDQYNGNEINVLLRYVTGPSKNEIFLLSWSVHISLCSGIPPWGGVQPDVMSSIDSPEGVGVVYRHTQVWYAHIFIVKNWVYEKTSQLITFKIW